MKHLAKDYYLKQLDQYNFELLRKHASKDKDGNIKRDENGDVREAETTHGYYSNFSRVWNAVSDLGIAEYINGDLNECIKFIEEAKKNMEEYVNDIR